LLIHKNYLYFFSFQGIDATPVDDDMRVWNALIDGPADTCYEDGLFTLRMEFAGIRNEKKVSQK
jgi:ubiquitin-protein ligase